MKEKVAIIGGGPKAYIPDLRSYMDESIYWIGADQGAEVLLEYGIKPDLAIGDFDSISRETLQRIEEKSGSTLIYPSEKDETDLELAVTEALKRDPEHILIFGVTGGRIDHFLANIQLLYRLSNAGCPGLIIDQQNYVELKKPGVHTMGAKETYPYISFLPVTLEVSGIHLEGFRYPLRDAVLPYGSTMCISNQLIQDRGTFSFSSGILLVIRSKDSNEDICAH